MSVSRYVALLLPLTSCHGTAPGSEDDGWQGFSLGVMPLAYAPPREMRYIVHVKRNYVRDELLSKPRLIDQDGRIIQNSVRFGVLYPSLTPTVDAWGKASVRVTIGNMVEDGISSSVDGSVINYLSRYTRVLPDAYGLRVREDVAPSPFVGRLYFDVTSNLHVRIECMANVHHRDRWCIMDARKPGEPYLSTGFYETEVLNWRERWNRLHGLFRYDGRQRLKSVRKRLCSFEWCPLSPPSPPLTPR